MARLHIRIVLDAMPDNTKDALIAPKISQLVSPEIPEIAADKHLVGIFVLNPKLAIGISNKNRQLLFNLIRKADDATGEYMAAAEDLNAFLQGRKLALSPYFSSLRHWEHCVGHLYQAVRCMNSLNSGWGGEKQFERGDGSILERVQIVHNAIKHMDDRFENGNLADRNSFSLFASPDGTGRGNIPSTETIPMWLTNVGLECANAKVSYSEIAQEIQELRQEAYKMATIGFGSQNVE